MLSASDREILANSYRLVVHNRDYLKYGIGYPLQLMDQAAPLMKPS